ncbi:MAG: lysophospholipid acyltransferase family protein [Pseudomonadota bacterium]
MIRSIRYVAEAFGLALILGIFRILPIDTASYIGGLTTRIFGKFSNAHLTADKNLKLAMPNLSQDDRRIILRGMWDNIGRVIGEYPHINRDIMKTRIKVVGIEHFDSIKNSKKAAMFVSCHFANWEIAPLAAAINGLPMVLIYRAANNPYVDSMLRKIRSKYNNGMYSKGREGAQNIIKAIKSNQSVAMLVDQKMNDGKALLFFGKKAMTATAATNIAIKMQVPLLVARVVRTKGANYQVTLEAPIIYNKDKDASQAMQELHSVFENWISELPEQWFWVHNRWG